MRRRRMLVVLVLLLLVLGTGGALVVLRGEIWPALEEADDVADVADADQATDDERLSRKRVRVETGGSPAETGASGDTSATGAASGAVDDEAGDGATPEATAESPSSEVVDPPGGPRLGGSVVDAATGEPVVGVRVLFAAWEDEQELGWYGDTTSDDGSFEHDVPTYWAERATRLELRIGRRGYTDVILPVTDADDSVKVELHPLPQAPVPGKVVVHAAHPDGTPITGVVLVGGRDGPDGLWQWAVADAAGRFELDGVPPGYWRLRLNRTGQEVEAILPDGGETSVQLVGPHRPWPQAMTEQEFRKRHAAISSRRPREVETDALVIEDEGRDAEAFDLAWRMQELETEWRAVAPRREVIVTGLPTDGPAWLRAGANGPNNAWRVRIVDGTARFAGLTYEHWDLRIERADGPGERYPVDVVAGDGPIRIDLAE